VALHWGKSVPIYAPRAACNAGSTLTVLNRYRNANNPQSVASMFYTNGLEIQ
jgi:hypothetical protein